MIIRLAHVEDAPAMAKVMVDTYLAAHRDQMPEEAWQKRKNEWTYEASEQGWTRTLTGIAAGVDPTCIYVAVAELDEIVGLAVGHPTESDAQIGEIGLLYVRDSYQGQGLGRRLVQTVAAHFAKMGIKALHISVLAANTPARRFYEAIGRRVVSERMFDEEGFLLPVMVYGWPDIRVFLP